MSASSPRDPGPDIQDLSVSRRPRQSLQHWLQAHAATNKALSTTHIHIPGQPTQDQDTHSQVHHQVDEENGHSTLQMVYLSMCQRYEVMPIQSLLRQLEDGTLSIKHTSLGSQAVKALSIPLQMSTQVTCLCLEGINMGSEGAKHVGSMLMENIYITELNLAHNQLRTEGGRYICDSLCSNRTLSKVNLSGNEFQDKDAQMFSNVLNSNNNLTALNLSNNEFREEGAVILAKAIAHNESLVHLDLSWNHIRLKGAEAIVQAIKRNQHLNELNLSMNGLGNIGACLLGQALMANHVLYELDVSNNRIHLEGAQGLAKGLSTNTGLTLLKVGKNPISSLGAFALIKAIEGNKSSSMQSLDVTGVLIRQDFLDSVVAIQHVRPTFHVVGTYVSNSTTEGRRGTMFVPGATNPLEVLLTFMAEKKLRVMDLFKNLDKDQSGSLERDEFIDGLKSIDTPLTVAQLDELIDMLDKDGDGEIDISEIMNINKEFRDVKMRAVQKAKENAQSKGTQAKKRFMKSVATVKFVNSLLSEDKL